MLYIVAYLILCVIAGLLGSDRELGFWGFLTLSLIITPLGTILVLALTKKRDPQKAK